MSVLPNEEPAGAGIVSFQDRWRSLQRRGRWRARMSGGARALENKKAAVLVGQRLFLEAGGESGRGL